MSESASCATTVSQTEIMIRNLLAVGYSEDDIQYEMDGYGCVRTFAHLLADERAPSVRESQHYSNGE